MTTTRFRWLALLALVAMPALAEDEPEGELVEKVAVRNRLFEVDDRFEVGGSIGLALLTRLTDHYNFNVTGAWNVAETFAIELRAGYAYSKHTGLADRIAKEFPAVGPTKTADLKDLWEMTANGVIGARWQPIYGKLGLMAELPVHFQLYLWAGGGVGLFKRDSVIICAQKAGADCGTYLSESKVGPLVSLALGTRFFITRRHAIGLEMRDYSYLDSYLENLDKKTVTAGTANPGGTPATNPGITNLVMLNVGYQFIF